MMVIYGLVIALWWLAVPSVASAHRLDEYLQATTIAVSDGHVVLRLRLTPGVAVASTVLAEIDVDQDGRISASEQSAFARAATAARALSIDGRATPLLPRTATFPSPASMRSGSGDIVLELVAPAPTKLGPHRLIYTQTSGRTPAVFLVNALTTKDAYVGDVRQSRSVDQSFYRLDYRLGRTSSSAPSPQGRAVLATFVLHGVRHILDGYDHLLFIGALALGAATFWDLLKVVTAFTIAHSLTLTLAVLGLVTVPARLVEPLISASIIFVAVQNLLRPGRTKELGRLVAAFVFGLVHGLGFAGGLLEVMHGMGQATLVLAIVGFSLGVELGNQLVLVPSFIALRTIGAAQNRGVIGASALETVRRVGSVAIALAGAFYLGAALSIAA